MSVRGLGGRGADPAIVVVTPDQTPISVKQEIVRDTNNSSTTPLGAGSTFTGAVTDISEYAQVNFAVFVRPNTVVSGDASDAKGSVFFEFSRDGTDWRISVPILVRFPGLFVPYPLINVHPFFRVRYLNDGGVAAIAALGLSDAAGTPTAQTVFELDTYLLPFATKELARTLDQGVSGSDPVSLGRNVIMGKNPNDSYSNLPATGTANSQSTNTPLGVSGVFNAAGTIIDMSGYVAATITILSDVASATGGILFNWYADAAGTRYLGPSDFTYGTPGVRTSVNVPRNGPFLRVTYMNGVVAQGSFELVTTLLVTAPPPDVLPIASTITGNNAAQIVKAASVGLREDGIYDNVGLSNSASLKVAITDRPSEVRDRVHVKEFITGVTLGAGTIIYTVPAGYVFYLNSIITSYVNTSVVANGQWCLQDGTDTADRIPFILGQAAAGAPAVGASPSPPLPEPIPFTTDVRAIGLAGTVIASVTVIGYSEPT